MAYDEELADRIRILMDPQRPIEKKMFGGIGFMVGGKMAIAASSKGGALVRVDPSEAEELCSRTGVKRMEMRGKEMDGWLRVDASLLDRDTELQAWIDRGIAPGAGMSRRRSGTTPRRIECMSQAVPAGERTTGGGLSPGRPCGKVRSIGAARRLKRHHRGGPAWIVPPGPGRPRP